MSKVLLEVDKLQAWYDQSHILQGVSISVTEGTVLSVLGRNGAGKTTLLNSIMAVLKKRKGRVTYAGKDIQSLQSYQIASLGIAYVPETRGIFPSLSVRENLEIAARAPITSGQREAWSLEKVYKLFPRLEERAENGGGQLSGGEQQMLSIARALMTNPDLLILDEPTEGLAPLVVQEIEAFLTELKQKGLTMLLVEQSLGFATSLADDIVILGKGKIRWAGAPSELAKDPKIQHTWLGV
jgi:branched-chain amino acid transport system ATP-binding protein